MCDCVMQWLSPTYDSCNECIGRTALHCTALSVIKSSTEQRKHPFSPCSIYYTQSAVCNVAVASEIISLLPFDIAASTLSQQSICVHRLAAAAAAVYIKQLWGLQATLCSAVRSLTATHEESRNEITATLLNRRVCKTDLYRDQTSTAGSIDGTYLWHFKVIDGSRGGGWCCYTE